MTQQQKNIRFTSNKDFDPILDNPDWHRVNSARRIHEINERLESMEQPLDKTNKRLAGIESYSEKMHEQSLNTAISNEKSAKLAIRVGICAIIFAILMPAIQIAYSEFWRAPQETQATKVIISDLKSEIADLKQQQLLMMKGISDAIGQQEKDAITILSDIKEVLENKSNPSQE